MLLFAIILPFIMNNAYDRHVLVLVLLYATLGSAWNILGGFAGQISVGNAIFFAIGAYTSSVLFVCFGVSPWIGMLVGGILAVGVSIFIGLPCFRLKGSYFIISTLALVQITQALATKWKFIGGARGFSIPLSEDSLANMQFKSKLPYYFIILGILIVTMIVVSLISESKIGYYFRTIKMDQEAAESLGINSWKYKLIAIMICAFITAIAGSFYAQYLQFIDPASIITFDLSLLILLVAVFGGVATVWGPILGAAILITLSEYTRTMIGGTGRGVDLIIYGLIVLLMVLYQPFGIIGAITNLKYRKAGEKIGKQNS